MHSAPTQFGSWRGAKGLSQKHMLQSADAPPRAAGIGPSDGEGGGSVWLKRAFSMLDKEDLEVDLSRLDSMAKVGLDWLTGLCRLQSGCDSLHAAASRQGGGPSGCMICCGAASCTLPGRNDSMCISCFASI